MKGGIIFITLGNKQTYLLLEREILTLSSKVVHYTNILEKIVWNKGSQCLCKQDVQKHRRPIEHCPLTQIQYAAAQCLFPEWKCYQIVINV